MPQRAIFKLIPWMLVALTASACGAEDDVSEVAGLYAAACDPIATIDLRQGGKAEVNRNYCEGYAVETWDYAVDGDTLTMALEGKLGRADSVRETFEITAPGELTQTSETSFIACGGCQSGAVWLAR